MAIPFIIRDDDTCFFTKPEELEFAYKEHYKKFPVTLATIPYVKKSYLWGAVPREYWHSEDTFYVDKNMELVEYIRKHLNENHFWIALHGIHHTYKVHKHKIIPEMLIGYKDLKSKFVSARQYLKKSFWVKVNEFVPPSNTLSIESYKVLDELGFNLLNLPWSIRGFNRPLASVVHSTFFFKRAAFLKSHGFDTMKPLFANGHYELWSIPLTPSTDIKILKKSFEYSIKKWLPYCVATHYWELWAYLNYSKNVRLKDILDEFLEFVSWFDVNPILAADFSFEWQKK